MTYRPEGGNQSSLQQLSDPAATEVTLTNLQCNTSYAITVVATAGEHGRESEAFLLSPGAVCEKLECFKFMETHVYCSHISISSGPQRLSVTVLSSTSVHLTWVALCNTQQYQIYYRGTCGTYGRLNASNQEYTFKKLQEGINYSFIVNQSGFSGGRVFSTGQVYAKTFTAGKTGMTIK